MSSPGTQFPSTLEVQQIVAHYEGYLARARSGAPFPNQALPMNLEPGPSTIGFYKQYALDGQKRWAVALEDERLGDWLWVDLDTGRVSTFSSVPAPSQLLFNLKLPEGLVTQLERPPRRIVRSSSWPPETTDLDLITAWIQDARANAIPYALFMDLWQFFDMLPAQLDAPIADRMWLSCAVYQHLWIGMYAPRVDVVTPEWNEDELSLLTERLRRGIEFFRAHAYPAD